MRYLQPQERSAYRVEWQAGKLLRQGKPYQTSLQKRADEPQTDAFVISLEGQFFAGAIQPGKFHHSSFLAGSDLLFAGEWETNQEGQIIKLTNRSGHYKPQSSHLLATLRTLQERGADLSKIELHEYSRNQIAIFSTAKLFMEKGLPNQRVRQP